MVGMHTRVGLKSSKDGGPYTKILFGRMVVHGMQTIQRFIIVSDNDNTIVFHIAPMHTRGPGYCRLLLLVPPFLSYLGEVFLRVGSAPIEHGQTGRLP
jgi:hypothetical protein